MDAQPTQPRLNPYVGPRSYTARDLEEGRKLYGRDRELLELERLLISERIVLLFSPSGAGKTSLINAALLPTLRAGGFRVLPVMRVGHEPVRAEDREAPGFNRYVFSALMSLEEGRPDAEQRELGELAGLRLPQYLDALTAEGGDADKPQLLVFDQFEEVLTLNPIDQEAKREFFAQLGEALRDRRRWALFSMREDYAAALDPFLRLVPTALTNTYRLDLLGEKAARLAIRNPAKNEKVDFTREAAQALVDDLRAVNVLNPEGQVVKCTGPYVDPVQLQVVCYRLWASLPEDAQVIKPEDLQHSGDVDHALADWVSYCVQTVAAEGYANERDIRRWMDQQLITKHNVRGQVLREHGQSQGLDNRAIDELINLHLLRAEHRRGSVWIELAHDRLIEPVRADNLRYRKSLGIAQRRAEEWHERGRPEWLLLRGDDLTEAGRWARAHPSEVTPLEAEYLKLSRRRRGTVILVGVMVLLSLGLAGVAGYMWVKASQAEAAATQSAKEAWEAKQVADSLSLRCKEEYLRASNYVAAAPEQVDDAALKQSFEFNDEYARLASSEAPASRRKTLVTYYPKLGDPPGVAKELGAIRTLGFEVAEREARNDVPINYVFYGADVSVQDAKLVSIALLRAGVKLKVVGCFPVSSRLKPNVIEVGAGTMYLNKDPVTLEVIGGLKQCERGAGTAPDPGYATR